MFAFNILIENIKRIQCFLYLIIRRTKLEDLEFSLCLICQMKCWYHASRTTDRKSWLCCRWKFSFFLGTSIFWGYLVEFIALKRGKRKAKRNMHDHGIADNVTACDYLGRIKLSVNHTCEGACTWERGLANP